MDLESKALSAPGEDAISQNNKSPPDAIGLEGDGESSSDDTSSVKPNECASGKRSRSASSGSRMNPSEKKRLRRQPAHAVVFYNIPPKADQDIVVDFIKRMFLEMHGMRIAFMKCRCISNAADRLTFLVSFTKPELAEVAMSLNGVQLMNHTIYLRPFNPDGNLDYSTHKKLVLCFDSYFGACHRGNKCHHAHGALELKLYDKTLLSESRTIYINKLPLRYAREDLLKTVSKRFKEHGVSPFFTALHVRGGKGDALVEFADIRDARKAYDILDGLPIEKRQMKVHPWKLDYKSAFVEYFEKYESKAKTDDIRRKDIGLDILPKIQNQDEQSVWEDEKHELRRLRDEVSKLKWYRQRLADLEDENSDYKRRLDEAQDDVRYYRDRYERERSYAKDVRRLEDKVDDLTRENDDLRHENDDLRKRQRDSRSSGNYRDMDNRLDDELRHTRLKYEESRDRVYNLKSDLDKTMEEKEVLERDSKRLKSSVKSLESNRTLAKMENEEVSQRQDELQIRLDEALTKIEGLNHVVTTTQLRLRDMESEKVSMNEAITDLQEQNETLEEEMQQMRMNHAMEIGFMGGE